MVKCSVGCKPCAKTFIHKIVIADDGNKPSTQFDTSTLVLGAIIVYMMVTYWDANIIHPFFWFNYYKKNFNIMVLFM